MSFRPDYGLRLLKEGFSASVIHNFYDFRLFSLTVLGHDQYSTMVDVPYAGEPHALSLDFTAAQLDQILMRANPQLRDFIRAQLTADPDTLRTIDFNGEVSFGVSAHLGQLQKAQEEEFVPLVAETIF